MFCKHCGNMLPDAAKFCDSCGAPVERNQSAPASAPVSDQTAFQPKAKVGFFEAVKLFFLNYINFSGRSRRSEYWYFFLFNCIMGFLLGLIVPDWTWIWSLIVLVPSISLTIRRLHDVGKSGWWYLMGLIPLAGAVILLIQLCKDSDPQPNEWGPSPKY